MLETTLAKLLAGKHTQEETAGCRLYMVSDEETVFYIGLSAAPVNRLKEHVGLIGRGQSELGACIMHSAPQSGKWKVQLFTLDDCLLYVAQYQTMDVGFYLERSKVMDRITMEAAEDALIMQYHPCLNTAKNPSPTPLPDKYEWRTIVNPFADKLAAALGLED